MLKRIYVQLWRKRLRMLSNRSLRKQQVDDQLNLSQAGATAQIAVCGSRFIRKILDCSASMVLAYVFWLNLTSAAKSLVIIEEHARQALRRRSLLVISCCVVQRSRMCSGNAEDIMLDPIQRLSATPWILFNPCRVAQPPLLGFQSPRSIRGEFRGSDQC